jgi:hypothetical protein
MSTPAPFDWGTLINSVLTAIGNVIKGVADYLGANASLIAEIVIGVGIFYFVYKRVLSRFLPGIKEFLGGLMG